MRRIRAGDIAIAKPRGLLRAILRWRGQSWWHVGVLDYREGCWEIIEATMPRVRTRPFASHDFAHCGIFRPHGATVQQGMLTAVYARGLVGQWYGLPDALRLAWRLLLQARYGALYAAEVIETLYCTELVRKSWRDGGWLDFLPGVDDAEILPDMVAEATARLW